MRWTCSSASSAAGEPHFLPLNSDEESITIGAEYERTKCLRPAEIDAKAFFFTPLVSLATEMRKKNPPSATPAPHALPQTGGRQRGKWRWWVDVIQPSLAEVLKCFPARAAVLPSVFVPVAALDTHRPALFLLTAPPLEGGRKQIERDPRG